MKNTTTSVYTFEELINNQFLYVDKTKYIYDLVKPGKGIYFLSRPRRFGKSLMLSTLKAVFQNKKELFKGFYLETSDYAWEEYPVIHLEIGAKKMSTAAELEEYLVQIVSYQAELHNITLKETSYDGRFLELITKLGRDDKIVILIDEYDKPILNNVDNKKNIQEILTSLKGFYSIIKSTEAHQRFVMLTGVSKFSRVSVFSDLNNLTDLTMSKNYATMFGYTQEELEVNFDEPITAIAKEMNLTKSVLKDKIKEWYNGYKFHQATETVYNPVSVMKFFESGEFSNYWFETGTPSFLLKLIKNKEFEIATMETEDVTELSFASYEIDRLEVLPLLFQTGYITIKDYFKDGNFRFFKLGFPNYEVSSAFNTYLADYFCNVNKERVGSYIYQTINALKQGNLQAVLEKLQLFFANVPYDITLKHEKYYQTIFYVFFKLLGIEIKAESRTNRGRIDAVVEVSDSIYIFEFKLHGTAEEALQQIHDNEYYGKYTNKGKKIVLVGAAFDQQTRNIENWLIQQP